MKTVAGMKCYRVDCEGYGMVRSYYINATSYEVAAGLAETKLEYPAKITRICELGEVILQ
jgi:hypothetical protein